MANKWTRHGMKCQLSESKFSSDGIILYQVINYVTILPHRDQVLHECTVNVVINNSEEIKICEISYKRILKYQSIYGSNLS